MTTAIDCKRCKALQLMIEGQEKLLVCYRIGTHKGIDSALNTIAKAKRMIAAFDEGSQS